MRLSNPETLYVTYQGEKPFIQATVTDKDDRVLVKFVDSSVARLIKEVKCVFRGYCIEARVPGVKQ